MDYPARERLKILGHARSYMAAKRPELVARLPTPDGREAVRVMEIEVAAYDWNCPQYIIPRYTQPQVMELVAPLQRRIRELEAPLKSF